MKSLSFWSNLSFSCLSSLFTEEFVTVRLCFFRFAPLRMSLGKEGIGDLTENCLVENLVSLAIGDVILVISNLRRSCFEFCLE